MPSVARMRLANCDRVEFVKMRRLSAFVLAAGSSLAYAASFDCDKAVTQVEKSICAEPGLSRLDEELNQAFRDALQKESTKATVIVQQKTWLKEVRDKCGNVQCLVDAYAHRIDAIKRRTFAAGATGVTGSWEYHGPAESGVWLMTVQSGKQVRFQLEIARGAPSYNTGWIEGEFELLGNAGTFRAHTDGGLCEIAFHFTARDVKLNQSGDAGGCEFGHNVFAEGTLKRKSQEMPVLSTGDPRFGH